MSTANIPSIFDTQSLTAIKGNIRKDDPQALRAAAQQFEAVFMQMVLKSMRAATPQDGLFDSEQTRFYQELLDSQLSQAMSANRGTGLAALIEKQLARVDALPAEDAAGAGAGFPLVPSAPGLPLGTALRALPLPVPAAALPLPAHSSPVRPALPLPPHWPAPPSPGAVPPAPTFSGAAAGDAPTVFTQTLLPHAVAASQQTGIPPQFLLAQAALESGWGRHEPRLADGRPSHNLFGIKAGADWPGPVAESVTTEFVAGQAQQRVERFRAYGSYTEAFNDHARLLSTQPRYAQVLGVQDATQFARGLQQAGYATDPAYADKLVRVIASPALSPTLNPALSAAHRTLASLPG